MYLATSLRARLVVGAGLAVLLGSCSGDSVAPHPMPLVLGVSPGVVVRGTGAVDATVAGSDFVAGSKVFLDTTQLVTTYEADTLLTAVIPATEVESRTGWRFVTVLSPAPGGGTSGKDSILVKNPLPVVDSIRPLTRSEGSPTDTLRFYGHGFYEGSYTWPGAVNVLVVQVDTNHMKAEITDGKLANPGDYAITFVQDPPGGGVSQTFHFLIPFPRPGLTAIAPDTVLTDAGAVPLRVYGTGFRDSTRISFAGVTLPTTWVSTTEVRATVPESLIAVAGTKTVFVGNPAPGGGASLTSGSMAVTQAPPRVTSIAPASGVAGDTGTITLAVHGRGFHAGDAVAVNGAVRATTVVADSILESTLLTSDRAAAGDVPVAVHDSATGATSSAVEFVVIPPTPGVTALDSLTLTVATWVHDPVRDMFWAAIPAGAPQLGGDVVGIDPALHAITDTLTGFGDPQVLAVSDGGNYLYVGRADAPEVVRYSFSNGARVSLPMPGNGGVLRAGDLLAVPGTMATLVVATMNPTAAPSATGAYVYDDTVRLPTSTQGTGEIDALTRGETPDRVYGIDTTSSDHRIDRLRLLPVGIDFEGTSADLTVAPYAQSEEGAGQIYLSTGPVIDAATLTSVGSLPTTGPFALDIAGGRVHVLTGGELRTFHAWTLGPIGSLALPQATGVKEPGRWGSDGIAFRAGTKVYFLRTPLVGN